MGNLFFGSGCPWHYLQILVTKQHHFVVSGKPKRQVRKAAKLHFVASLEITRCVHSIFACSRHMYVGVLQAHLVRGESHIQHIANREVVTLAVSLG